MREEYFDVVNEKDEVVGKAKRSECHSNPKLIHRGIYVVITNPAGNILLQKRSMKTDTNRGRWDVLAGHNDLGESYEAAALREIKEELGIRVELKKLAKMLIRFSNETEVDTIFHGVTKETSFNYSKDEIDEVRFFTLEEIEKLDVSEKLFDVIKVYLFKTKNK